MRTLADGPSWNSLCTEPKRLTCVGHLNIHSPWESGLVGGPRAVMSVTIQSSTSYLFFEVPGGFLICLQNPTWPRRRPSIVCIWPKWPFVYLAMGMLMCLGRVLVPDPSGGIIEHVVYGPYYFSQVRKTINSQTSGPRGPGKGLADLHSTDL